MQELCPMTERIKTFYEQDDLESIIQEVKELKEQGEKEIKEYRDRYYKLLDENCALRKAVKEISSVL